MPSRQVLAVEHHHLLRSSQVQHSVVLMILTAICNCSACLALGSAGLGYVVPHVEQCRAMELHA